MTSCLVFLKSFQALRAHPSVGEKNSSSYHSRILGKRRFGGKPHHPGVTLRSAQKTDETHAYPDKILVCTLRKRLAAMDGLLLDMDWWLLDMDWWFSRRYDLAGSREYDAT